MAQLRSPPRDSLATLDPRDLCNEAKVEKCRAVKDLRSCGRTVHHLLVSCSHACLCAECSQRCDVCPICGTTIARKGATIRLRLYDQFLEAGLVSAAGDDDCRELWTVDVRRLHSFFDVALEQNMASLICHYVLDVCLDETAVSSDAVVAMLLDGAVVKEWCKKTYVSLARSLGQLYDLGTKQICSRDDFLDKCSMKLEGVAHVLEALEAPLIDSNSASLREVQQLLEGVRKWMQHLEVVTWSARHCFLENVPSRYASTVLWKNAMKDRKMAAQERAWPDYVAGTGQLGPKPQPSLFIEDALSNLAIVREDEDEGGRTPCEMSWSGLSQVSSASLRVRRDGPGSVTNSPASLYPPESIVTAIDLLFLEGSSDMVLAKRAIFLYYLFDRHWTLADTSWRSIIDDYVGTFCIPRSSVLESFAFFLLDDNSKQAVEVASQLLKEIVGPTTHPKVPRVLLERQNPKAALVMLRCSGRELPLGQMLGGSEQSGAVPLSEAVTAVRVLVTSGLFTEAFLFQRAHCARVKSDDSKKRSTKRQDSRLVSRKWSVEMDVLVGEFCWFCIRNGMVDKMLELPWHLDEERVLRKCLFERATQDPSSTAGNLLAVYYIQRCRYVEAHYVHKRLSDLEQHLVLRSSDEEKISRIRSASGKRALLTEKSIELLPELQKQQLLSGQIPDPFADSSKADLCSEDMDDEETSSTTKSPFLLDTIGSVRLLPGPSSLTTKSKSEFNHASVRFPGDATSQPPAVAGHGRPSILHMQSPLLAAAMTPQQSLPKGPTPRLNGNSGMGAGPSPILGRRLRYDSNWDSTTIGIYS